MRTNQSSPDQPHPPQKKMLLPQRDTVTNMQIHTLLQVAGQLTVILVNPMREPGSPQPESLDGGVQSAAESALIKCCARLEDILDDKDRWSMQSQDTLEKSLEAAYAAQIGFYNEQTSLTKLMQTPHHLYKPDLAPTSDGRYIAFAGRLDKLDISIYGIGDSPSAAMAAFDEVFNGRIPEDMLHYLAMRAAAIEAGEPRPELPQQNKTHESKKLDKRRSRKANETQKRRKNQPRNSGGNEPLDQGS